MDVFITGGTGILGREVVKKLEQDQNVETMYVLTRTRQQKENASSKVVFLQGDITAPFLGLTEEQRLQLASVEEIYHLAADLTLSTKIESKQGIFEVNVNGMQNLLDIAKTLPLKCFYFVSTAYACGNYPGKVPEGWLTEPESFRNFYEESKWRAEQVLKKYHEGHNVPYLIFRPSILLSDGFHARNQTVYLYGMILGKVARETAGNIRLLGSLTAKLNLVHVNTVISFIFEARNKGETNRIYNIVNSESTPITMILDSIQQGLNIRRFDFASVIDDPTSEEQAAHRITAPFAPYTLGKLPEWDVTNADRIRQKAGIRELSNTDIYDHFNHYFRKVVLNDPTKCRI